MQKVVLFKTLSFWSSQPNISELNSKIASLNNEGWSVVSITPSYSIAGLVRSYTLLLEKQGTKT